MVNITYINRAQKKISEHTFVNEYHAGFGFFCLNSLGPSWDHPLKPLGAPDFVKKPLDSQGMVPDSLKEFEAKIDDIQLQKCSDIFFCSSFAHFRLDKNHDLAITRSSSSCVDPELRVAFKCLNV